MQDKILSLLKQKTLKPGEIAGLLNISRQAIHKHLLTLLRDHQIQKHGTGPHVSYSLVVDDFTGRLREHYDFCRENCSHSIESVIRPISKKI